MNQAKKNDIAIKIENLGKDYIIGDAKSGSLRESITSIFKNSNQKNELFSALSAISLNIYQGQAVGIIGKNGAGKSTLLKLLSKITYPSKGKITINGRVSSLLEVGTGFHPELTGRENIFLNGTILGMSRAEIKSKFDQIVDFSGIEKFLDTPVKRYSSGMYVRLAFAVAAHLDPEILIIDEVLAVGDAEFQKKCLGKMDQVAKNGRTVIFVSHNMEAIQNFCSTCLLINNGKLIKSGPTSEVIREYLNLGLDVEGSQTWKNEIEAPGNDKIKLNKIFISALNNEPYINVDSGLNIIISFRSYINKLNLGITLYLTNDQGILLFESGMVITDNKDSKIGIYEIDLEIPGHLLNSGFYFGKIVIAESQRYVLATFDNIFKFEVSNTSTGRDNNFSIAPGVIRPLLKWNAKIA
tara:strand:- start:1494 stop:2726 length:1233 start_codon:yes stop_codon:yes gene_type:complete